MYRHSSHIYRHINKYFYVIFYMYKNCINNYISHNNITKFRILQTYRQHQLKKK